MVEVPEVSFTAQAARRSWGASRYWLVGFFAFATCVMLGLPAVLDRWIFELARPHDEWGPSQGRWAHVVDVLSPPVVVGVLAAVTITVCLLNRTVRPAVVATGFGAGAAAVTLLVKLVVARADPHATGSGHGGSFPSGHTVGVVVCIGLAVHLLLPLARRWACATAGAAGAVMGVALVVTGAHWATDVVGGLLLGMGVLVAATTTPSRERDQAVDDPSEGDRITDRPVS
jgi:membrane-associated phospholipid phosphatase